MTADRAIQNDTVKWRGVLIEITYEVSWLSIDRPGDRAVAHLTVTAIEPKRARLPITETGFRSRFLDPAEVDGEGGPVAYVAAWLDAMSRSQDWLEYEQSRRQLSLF